MSWYLGTCSVLLLIGATALLVARVWLSLFGARTTGARLWAAPAALYVFAAALGFGALTAG